MTDHAAHARNEAARAKFADSGVTKYAGRTYEIERTDFDLYELRVDGKLWDGYATLEQARAGLHHHAGRMAERNRWIARIPLIALVVVIAVLFVSR